MLRRMEASNLGGLAAGVASAGNGAFAEQTELGTGASGLGAVA